MLLNCCLISLCKWLLSVSTHRSRYNEMQAPPPRNNEEMDEKPVSVVTGDAMPAGGGLTWIGLIWALLSTIATALIVGGLLTPEWLIGTVRVNDHEMSAYFGAYKRCNYPVFDREANRVALVSDCGRYESFSAVPSHFWQLAIISAASGEELLHLSHFFLTFHYILLTISSILYFLLLRIGSSLSLLLVLLLLPSICMSDIVTNSSALIVGFFQIIAAVLVSAALVLYPLGWDNPEVRDACGPKASRFNLGSWKHLIIPSID
uniref:Aa_trans domain-containing protein n=1 Tax=Heterorhabditis bacteriophora TaxID=37862 RepID=A0A1I7WU21_HETBA